MWGEQVVVSEESRSWVSKKLGVSKLLSRIVTLTHTAGYRHVHYFAQTRHNTTHKRSGGLTNVMGVEHSLSRKLILSSIPSLLLFWMLCNFIPVLDDMHRLYVEDFTVLCCEMLKPGTVLIIFWVFPCNFRKIAKQAQGNFFSSFAIYSWEVYGWYIQARIS